MKKQKLKGEITPLKKLSYEKPLMTTSQIIMEYSIASGSGPTSVQQGTIKDDWDGSSSEEKEIYF
ncbi:hypothetical protein [Sphingobacterium puteale]|uniref:hypothetical protein n=1 Tax=Sphingobacterium puteale TaxID=2420510 RepID=UPI003D99F023